MHKWLVSNMIFLKRMNPVNHSYEENKHEYKIKIVYIFKKVTSNACIHQKNVQLRDETFISDFKNPTSQTQYIM